MTVHNVTPAMPPEIIVANGPMSSLVLPVIYTQIHYTAYTEYTVEAWMV